MTIYLDLSCDLEDLIGTNNKKKDIGDSKTN